MGGGRGPKELIALNVKSNIEFAPMDYKMKKKTFGDPDRARMACTQLHNSKMIPGTTAEDYTARFEMLAGRTGFNDEALEDTYIRGLPNSILQKVFAQVTLPTGLDTWKTVVRNLDRLHRGLVELKRSTGQTHESSDRLTATGHCHCQSVYTLLEAVQVEISCTRGKSQTAVVITCTSRASTGLC